MAGGLQWNVAAVITVVGWLVSPIITLLLPKILSCLGFDPSKKLRELEIRIIPELQQTLRAVDQERMMQREKKLKCDLAALDKMAAMLRHTLEDAEDILDDAQHKIFAGDILYDAVGFLCRFIHMSGDVDTLMADLKKISSELDTLLPEDDASRQLSPVDRVRMLPKTLRADLLKTLPELRMLLKTLRPEDIDEDFHFIDKLVILLRQADEEAEDAHGGLYSAMEAYIARCHTSCVGIARIVGGDILYGAVQTCIDRFNRNCLGIAGIVRSGLSRLLQWARNISISRRLLHRSEEALPVTISAVASDESIPVTTTAVASDESAVPVAAPSYPSGRWLSCLCSSFDFLKNCCTSLYNWLVHVFEIACFYRDWSYDVVGITSYQENASVLDFVLTAITRRSLKKRIYKVESTVGEVKESPLLGVASNNAPNDIANKNRIQIRTDSYREVFGRQELRDDIMAKLRERPHGDAPSSSTSQCYTVIGIYGIPGSGKTTFARYIRDYIQDCEEKLFDTVMCIHVSETFNVNDIYHEMLKDITEDSYSNISDCGDLKKKLKESLRDKRFFLILDDLWVKNKNNLQLEELISPLNVGAEGSKVLVTARTKVAARALCVDEPIEMPNLDEDHYLSMFMNYALGGTSDVHEEFIRVGREIAEKLHRSPIAAVTVAGQIGTNRDIKFWRSTAKLDMLNDTMDALWWSYQQLNPDIRRCFEFCNIFPRRSKLRTDQLVRLWIAHGFVKASCATEDMEDVGEHYIQELVSCSFLQPEEGYFKIHDLLHDLAEKVAGSDCFRIENERSSRGEGWRGDIPQDVRHLFVQNYDADLITEKILGLENLRTLIIYVVAQDKPVERKVIESICKRLLKLRVLAVAFSQNNVEIIPNLMLSIPGSISQLKHLRYLSFRRFLLCTIILPSALAKLHHIQVLDFGSCERCVFSSVAGLINLRHMFCSSNVKFPNIGRLISLQTIPGFTVRNEQGYEVKQLRDLNKLRGCLVIWGLGNVKSKVEALEANLAAKERLTYLTLSWSFDGTRCSPEVEADILEGLCPPVGLETLEIGDYEGSRYPDWMVGKQNGGPKDLKNLFFIRCSQLGPGPELEAFSHLRWLWIEDCSWDALPGNMEHLTSLKQLKITRCRNIWSLPTLPQSLEVFQLGSCNDEFTKSCVTVGHPNWEKVEHISEKIIYSTRQ